MAAALQRGAEPGAVQRAAVREAAGELSELSTGAVLETAGGLAVAAALQHGAEPGAFLRAAVLEAAGARGVLCGAAVVSWKASRAVTWSYTGVRRSSAAKQSCSAAEQSLICAD